MKIIKKNGNIEEFKKSKITTSLINASTEINEPLSDGDLSIIEKYVTDKLSHELKREATSSYEVFAILLYALKDLKFGHVGKAYFDGSLHF